MLSGVPKMSYLYICIVRAFISDMVFIQRGVSIKATPLSLVMSDSKEKSYLLNVFDTPGMMCDRLSIKTVRYYHKIPRYDGIVIVTKF